MVSSIENRVDLPFIYNIRAVQLMNRDLDGVGDRAMGVPPLKRPETRNVSITYILILTPLFCTPDLLTLFSQGIFQPTNSSVQREGAGAASHRPRCRTF